MSYVIFRAVPPYLIVKKTNRDLAIYNTAGAAKTGRTALYRKNYNEGDLLITDMENYNKNFRTKVKKINLMSGQEYEEDANTPACCSPASETYWSM